MKDWTGLRYAHLESGILNAEARASRDRCVPQAEIPQGTNQPVDVIDRVIQRQGSSDGALEAEAAQDGLGTMMAGPNSDSIAVEVVAYLFGPEAIHDKGNDAGLLPGGSNNVQPGNAQ